MIKSGFHMFLNTTFDSQCQTLNEEEIFDIQDKRSLFPLGWIHVSITSRYVDL